MYFSYFRRFFYIFFREFPAPPETDRGRLRKPQLEPKWSPTCQVIPSTISCLAKFVLSIARVWSI